MVFKKGGYISFSDPFQISNPSQLFCNSSTLLKSFSKGKPSQNHLTTYRVDLLNQNTFSDPSQMEYMFYFSKPSQILIQRNLLRSISNLPHQITFSKPSQHMISYEIDHVLLGNHQSPKTDIVLISPPIYFAKFCGLLRIYRGSENANFCLFLVLKTC